MEKIKIKIHGREYSLMSDESPERIVKIAKALDMQIEEASMSMKKRTEEEILTLVALNILDETDKLVTVKNNELLALKKRTETEKENDYKEFNENIKSAESELEQIANIKDEENESLRQKLVEYEKNFESFIKEREEEIKKLNESFNSAISEMEHIATVKESENNNLRNTLNSYEASFDLYVKTKEEEIKKLNIDLENVNTEIDELRQRLAALSDDGQLTIC